MAYVLISALLGAAWRRWLGSARPEWAWTGYRATQIAAGFIVLALIQVVAGDYFYRCALDSALAIGFMTLPIQYSRRPFEWLMEKIDPPKLWGTMLNGPAPWSEALQGACLWLLAVAL